MDKKNLRIFGLIWSAIFAFIAFKSENFFDVYASVSLIFLATAICAPGVFVKTKFYQTWIKVGDFLGLVNSKIISFFLFYAIFSPLGICLKIFGKDLLKKKLQPSASSYFIDRATQPGDMKNQF